MLVQTDTIKVGDRTLAMDVNANHIVVFQHIVLDVFQGQVLLEELPAVGAVLLPIVDDYPYLAGSISLGQIFGQVEEAELEPCREVQWLLQRLILKLQVAIVSIKGIQYRPGCG